MVEAIQDDITTLDVDVIVNAANKTLLGGGGVDGAIHRAAGPELLQACRKFGGCETGEARITPGFALPAHWIIHTPGPVWRDGHHGEPELLASCYRESLRLAAKPAQKASPFPTSAPACTVTPKRMPPKSLWPPCVRKTPASSASSPAASMPPTSPSTMRFWQTSRNVSLPQEAGLRGIPSVMPAKAQCCSGKSFHAFLSSLRRKPQAGDIMRVGHSPKDKRRKSQIIQYEYRAPRVARDALIWTRFLIALARVRNDECRHSRATVGLRRSGASARRPLFRRDELRPAHPASLRVDF